jgi:hypothetical protein
MTAPQRGKNRPCGTWSGVGTPTTGRSPYPAGSRRRQEDRPGLLHPPYDAFVSTGAACATQMLEIARLAVGQDDTDHPDDVGQGAWHCTVHLVYGVLHGLVLPVWRGDGI